MNGKSIKKICFISVLLLAVLLFYFSFDLSGFHPYAKEDFEKYSQGLAEISVNYLDDYDSRIIVKSDYVLPDRGSVLHASGFAGLNVFQYKNAADADKALEYYSSLSYVDYAVKDALVSGEEDVIAEESGYADPTYTPAQIDQMKAGHLSWGAEMLGIDNYRKEITDKYQALGEELPTVYVAVLDTGVDTDNEYLQGRLALNYGRNFYEAYIQNNTNVEDGYGHGTHVSGTITDLTLPNVKIIPVKVLNDDNSGSVMSIVSGMQYVLKLKQEQNLNIVAYNMSLGGLGQQQSEYDAIISSYQNNMLAVVSAGNSSYYGENYTPGNCETALTISALAQNETYAKFPHIADYSNYGAFVDLCLPGTNVLSSVPHNYSRGTVYTSSTGGKYALMSGTSMAAPHATAMVALYATYMGAEYQVANAESTLKNSAIDLGDLGWDPQYGYGVPTFDFAFAEKSLIAEPTLSFGTVGETCNFQGNSINVTITDNNSANGQSEIYYSLDGSVPSLLYHEEYSGGITIDKSSLLRFVIYRFDGDKVTNRSEIYEVTYYKGNQTVNDDGTGFEINSSGRLTSYTSGLKHIVIPTKVNGVTVTGFGKYLFRGLNVESVVAEQALHMNGFHPFYCTATLKKLSIGSENWNPNPSGPPTEMSVLAKSCYGLKELYLPNLTYLPMADQGEASNPRNGVIGSKLFERCTNLEKIYAPKVTDVRAAAFSCFARLKEIELDWENLTKIGDYAFDRCSALETVFQLPDVSGKTYSVGAHAFEGSGITAFQSADLTSVSESAFADCKNLSYVVLPNVETLGKSAFAGCENLSAANLPALKTVGEKSFENCKNLEVLDLENVETIGNYAFSGAGIQSANLKNLTTLNQYTFSDCANLYYVILGSNTGVINYASAWLSSFNTKILLIDREYTGNVSSFIKSSYSNRYDFEEYAYVIYAVDKIYTVTFRLNANKLIETRRFLHGSKITAPETFTLGAHVAYTFYGWKDGKVTYSQNNLPSASKNFVFYADGYGTEILTPHEESDWMIVQEAGCTLDGLQEKQCTICGEVTDTQIIDAHGQHNPHTVVDVEATCTEMGRERSVCNLCGETLETTELPALGHDPQTVVDWEATCTAAGQKRSVCNTCGETLETTELPAFGHTLDSVTEREPTCTKTGKVTTKCTVCEEVVGVASIPALGHDPQIAVDREPTCTEAGIGHSVCNICGETLEPPELPALGHTEESVTVSEPTCTKNGQIITKCTVCNEVVSDTTVPALGHTWGDWEPVNEGTGAGNSETRKCSVCEETEMRTIVDLEKTADFVAKVELIAERTKTQKFEAIKNALNAYALLSDAEKDSVSNAYANLLSEIDAYNASAEKSNGELTAAMRNGISVAVTAVATAALALALALGKRRFL